MSVNTNTPNNIFKGHAKPGLETGFLTRFGRDEIQQKLFTNRDWSGVKALTNMHMRVYAALHDASTGESGLFFINSDGAFTEKVPLQEMYPSQLAALPELNALVFCWEGRLYGALPESTDPGAQDLAPCGQHVTGIAVIANSVYILHEDPVTFANSITVVEVSACPGQPDCLKGSGSLLDGFFAVDATGLVAIGNRLYTQFNDQIYHVEPAIGGAAIPYTPAGAGWDATVSMDGIFLPEVNEGEAFSYLYIFRNDNGKIHLYHLDLWHDGSENEPVFAVYGKDSDIWNSFSASTVVMPDYSNPTGTTQEIGQMFLQKDGILYQINLGTGTWLYVPARRPLPIAFPTLDIQIGANPANHLPVETKGYEGSPYPYLLSGIYYEIDGTEKNFYRLGNPDPLLVIPGHHPPADPPALVLHHDVVPGGDVIVVVEIEIDPIKWSVSQVPERQRAH